MSASDNRTKWNDRFSDEAYIYGKEPNLFFREFIDSHKPGRILLPAEGEGRNAVYAATKGWEVTAFDFSEEARNKALKLATEAGVTIRYEICDLEQVTVVAPSTPESSHSCRLQEASYDAVGLLFVHMPPAIRGRVHQTLIRCLKPGGYLLLEAFNKNQIRFNTGGQADGRTGGQADGRTGGQADGRTSGQADKRLGGPKEISLLFSQEELAADFAELYITELYEFNDTLSAGIMHTGPGECIRCLAQKPHQPNKK